MEAYRNWVRTNKDYVHSLESLANGLTWFLPERFSQSEIGPEAVTAILGIITAINTHIIDTAPNFYRGSAEPSSFPYGLWISATKDIESLVEVVAQQIYGDDKKWNFIAVMEAMKVLVRLALFRSSGYHMLLSGVETPNIENETNISSSYVTGGAMRYFHGKNPWNLEEKALYALNKFRENDRVFSKPTWLQKVQHQNMIIHSPTPVKRRGLITILSEKGLPGGLFVTGEVLYITRPLIYILFIRKYGVRSWVPWFLSLAMDLIGISILSRSTMAHHNTKGQNFVLSDLEKDEVKRRKLLWALYLMRDPFFSTYTRSYYGKYSRLQKISGIGLKAL